LPARRVRPDRAMTAAERQARYRSRYNAMDSALWFIAERASSIEEARNAAAQALKGRVDWNAIYAARPDPTRFDMVDGKRSFKEMRD